MTPTRSSRLAEIEAIERRLKRAIGPGVNKRADWVEIIKTDGEDGLKACAIARGFEADAQIKIERLEKALLRCKELEERAERAEADAKAVRAANAKINEVCTRALKERDAAWADGKMFLRQRDEWFAEAEKARAEADALRNGVIPVERMLRAWSNHRFPVDQLGGYRPGEGGHEGTVEISVSNLRWVADDLQKALAGPAKARGSEASLPIERATNDNTKSEPTAARPARADCPGKRSGFSDRMIHCVRCVNPVANPGPCPQMTPCCPGCVSNKPAPAPPSKAICGVCGEGYEGEGPGGFAHGHKAPPPEACDCPRFKAERPTITGGLIETVVHRPACPSRRR